MFIFLCSVFIILVSCLLCNPFDAICGAGGKGFVLAILKKISRNPLPLMCWTKPGKLWEINTEQMALQSVMLLDVLFTLVTLFPSMRVQNCLSCNWRRDVSCLNSQASLSVCPLSLPGWSQHRVPSRFQQRENRISFPPSLTITLKRGVQSPVLYLIFMVRSDRIMFRLLKFKCPPGWVIKRYMILPFRRFASLAAVDILLISMVEFFKSLQPFLS